MSQEKIEKHVDGLIVSAIPIGGRWRAVVRSHGGNTTLPSAIVTDGFETSEQAMGAAEMASRAAICARMAAERAASMGID